jgi:hypothetical protein
LEPSPFFKELGIKYGSSELVYPDKNIRVIAVSVRSADALGRDVFGGIIDETDFMEGSVLKGSGGLSAPGNKPFAELLHESITRRMKSRYDRAGILPGKLFLSSSARHKGSFTNRRVGEAANESSVFCREYAIYDVAPKERFSDKSFWVLVGNERIRHKILSKEEFRKLGRRGRTLLEESGCRFIKVPENFRSDFERNIEDSIRDVAGVVTVTLSPFIQLRDRIYDMVDPTLFHPMSCESWRTDEYPHIFWDKITRMVTRRVGPGHMEQELCPIRHPEAVRHLHIDFSLGRSDAMGLCIAHTAGVVDVERRIAESGEAVSEQVPLIEVDLMLRIEAPPNGEIDLGAVRGLVYDFGKHGFNISFASSDWMPSADTLQQFEQRGINAEKISVDKTMEPYTYLKTAIYEGRVSIYKYPIVLQELEQLQRDESKGKIDHVPGGCFTGETRVPLLDGTIATMAELNGKEDWVYSSTLDGQTVSGRARGRMTKMVSELVDVVLDNDSVERCTPDHRWMLKDGTYKEAKDLVSGRDILMPISRRWDDLCETADGAKRGVRAVVPVHLHEAVPVYDLEVDGYHNFALCSGVFVHNSKDVADGLAGIVYSLSTRQVFRAPLLMGESEFHDPDAESEWIRKTMERAGEQALRKVGDVPPGGDGPIVFSG